MMASEETITTSNTVMDYISYSCENGTNVTNCTRHSVVSNTTNLLVVYYLWTIVTPIIFSLIILIGTVGNSMVIYVIISRPKMRTTTNILLLNLAIADIAFLLICVPFQADKYVSFAWKHGQWLCHLVQYCLYVTAYVTVWTLTAIAFIRYFTVVWSRATARYRTKTNITYLCIFVWILMMVINIPTLLAHQINISNNYSYCGINPDRTTALLLSFFICAYVLPLLIICLLYVLIIFHLHSNRSTTLNTSSKRESRAARASKTIVIVVVVFCISWLPLHIISMMSLFGTVPDSLPFQIFRIVANCMAYGNSLANPFIYHYASQEFRNAFHEIFSSKCCKQSTPDGIPASFRTTTYKMTEIEPHDDNDEEHEKCCSST